MSLNRGVSFLGLIIGALLMAGCASLTSSKSTGETQTQAPVAAPAQDDLLRVGDKIKIELTGLPGSTPTIYPIETTIKDDGTVTLTHIGAVKAAGKTPGQLETDIHERYVPAYYTQITVNVTAMDRFYYVGGQVNKPDKQLYVGAVTVSKAIQAAGDFTEWANRKDIQITRVHGKVEHVNYSQILKRPELDLPIYPGDSIFVDRRW